MPDLIKNCEKSKNNADDLITLLFPPRVGFCVCVFDCGVCSA